ncbi:MAG: M14 family zinc carboxypeptidase [bacterium]
MRRRTAQIISRFYPALVRPFYSRGHAGALACRLIVLAALATAVQTSVMLVRKNRSKYPQLPTAGQPGVPREPWSFRSLLSHFFSPSKPEEIFLFSTSHAGLLPSFPPRHEHTAVVPEAYPTLAGLEQQFNDLIRDFPHLARLHHIGTSTARLHPIIAIRLSDHPEIEEDEPAVLFTALHHAREPAGVYICSALIQELLTNYEMSARHRRLLDSLDIWLVPLVNPDGYQYILENQRQFPWWRKNLRDNDDDGQFNPLVDGVDLNRNYDYNWEEGGEGEAGSWFYRGRSAFSETEIQTLRNLELQQNFVIGVSFHSYGEAVLYPWGNFHRAPDQDLILDIARQYASRIGRLSGQGAYNVLPLNGRVGQSSVWMYGAGGVIDFICETGEEYFPPLDDLFHLSQQNVNGAMFLLERALRSGICGHVVDAETGAPLEAEIVVNGFERNYVKPRHSHPEYGRFDRLLLPGVYEVHVQKKGYQTARFEKIEVRAETSTRLEVALHRETPEDVMSNE